MRRETKRDEVHESVRCGTLDSPHGRIQGLPQARRKTHQLDLGASYLVHRADDGAFDTLSDCASAALSGKCLLEP
jgi:hypothetical protein